MSETLAQAGKAVDTRKQPVPGATPFVPSIPQNAPEYIVVNQPFFHGRLYEIGERVKFDGPIIKELGSPGRCLMPVNHQGPWPPKSFAESEQKAKKRAREEWVRDMARP